MTCIDQEAIEPDVGGEATVQGETIVCVAPRAWNSLWRSSQQHMSRIAKQNRVLYIEPGRNYERSQIGELYRNSRYFVSPEARSLTDNLIIVPTPPALPYVRERLPQNLLTLTSPVVAFANVAIMTRQIRWAIKEFTVKNPILWIYEPRHLALAGRFDEKLVCYFIHDEFADLPQNHRIAEFIQRHDDALTRRADVVFACSPWIAEKRKKLNPSTYLILNSVDYELFHRALDDNTSIPEDIAGVARPTIGVVGGLDNRIDAHLLTRLAEAYPDRSILLIGPDGIPGSSSKTALQAKPNVKFIGKKSLEDLPRYLKGLDVALIPYEIREDTLPLYPLKLHEYLAAGRAIVSTALPEVKRFSPLVRVADTSDEFIAMVAAATTDYRPERIEARVSIARQNTWDQRLIEIYAALGRHLPGAPAPASDRLVRRSRFG